MDEKDDPRVDDKPEAEEASDEVEDLEVSRPEAKKVRGAIKWNRQP